MSTIKVVYVWCDGNQEISCHTREEALNIRELRGQGKVWRMEYSEELA